MEDKERGIMIDLSHLTDEEQERILKVLNRDTELKRHEEERVRYIHHVTFMINLIHM